jgi:Protein of unknown function (DUF2889)
MVIRVAHEGHGPREPVLEVPPRAPGSVRRTSTVDVSGARTTADPLVIRGAARDLATTRSGEGVVRGGASVLVEVDRSGPRPLIARVEPGVPDLVGAPAQGGFRSALRAAMPAEVVAATPLHLLLDDVPGVLVASGYARAVEPPAGARYTRGTPPADVCSGWRSDGTMMIALRRDGAMPLMSGPSAPPLRTPGDPVAWHDARELAPGEVRRARRVDVVDDGGSLRVEAMFRDSYRDTDGDESVVHEYRLDARVDRHSLRILELAAEPRVLPWTECPVAAASGARLVGLDVREVRGHVRGALVGTSTCTHLNDLLRSLGDVAALAAVLDRS